MASAVFPRIFALASRKVCNNLNLLFHDFKPQLPEKFNATSFVLIKFENSHFLGDCEISKNKKKKIGKY